MSWIIGLIRKNKIDYSEALSLIINNALVKYYSTNLQVYAGGFLDNLHFSTSNKTTKEGWIISGIGLQNNA